MSHPVHILVTCRDKSLLDPAVLVFETLRKGFPSAAVHVYLNNISPELTPSIEVEAKDRGCHVTTVNTIHHEWIAKLLTNTDGPFWICDTDVIFWDKVEGWEFDAPLAGRRIPEWNDEFTGARTRARLHTSLLYFDPMKISNALGNYTKQFAGTVFNPLANLIYPLMTPFKGGAYFYDTCGMLYHAVGGQAFSDKELDQFDHLNFGTIPDVVLPRLTGGAVMDAVRKEIYKDPIKAKGLWRTQEQYYQSRQ